MKKISFVSLVAVLALPAFAVEDVHKLYGKEPVDPEIVAQYEKQFKKPEIKDLQENQEAKEVQEVKKVKEIKEVEEVKKVKEVPETKEPEATRETKEYTEYAEPKYEAPSNPKARFPHGLQLGIGMSATSGLNGFIGYNNKNFDSFWAKRFGIRFDFATMAPIKSKLNKEINKVADDKGGIEIDDTLKVENFALNAKHYGAMIDFYPFGDTWFLGGWRISGGYFFGKLNFDADIHGTPDESGKVEFELNHHKYYYADEMRAKAMADWKYNGPYVGTGFDLGLFWGFKIYLDAGVVYTGKAAKLDMDTPLTGLEDASHNPIVEGSAEHDQFITDKNKELDDARKEIKDYPYYPLVKLGFMYRF